MWAVFRFPFGIIAIGVVIDILRALFSPRPRLEPGRNLARTNVNPFGWIDSFRTDKRSTTIAVFLAIFLLGTPVLSTILHALGLGASEPGQSIRLLFDLDMFDRLSHAIEGQGHPSIVGVLLCMLGMAASFAAIGLAVWPRYNWAVDAERRYLARPSLFETSFASKRIFIFVMFWFFISWILGMAKWGPAFLLIFLPPAFPLRVLNAAVLTASVSYCWACFLAPLEFVYLMRDDAVAANMLEQQRLLVAADASRSRSSA